MKTIYRFDAEFVSFTMEICQGKSGWKVSPAFVLMAEGARVSIELSFQDLIFHDYTRGTLCSVQRLHKLSSCFPHFTKCMEELKGDQERVMRMIKDMKKKNLFSKIRVFFF